MAEEFVWIITEDSPEPADAMRDGTRGGRGYNPFDDPGTVTIPPRRGVPVRAEKLEQGMTDFLQVVGRVFNQVKQRTGELAGMDLDEIELSVEINGEGQVSLLGSGGKVGGKGGMTLRFKKVESQSTNQV